MRFSAKSTELGHIDSFIRLISTIAKLTRTVTIRIVPDHLSFIKQEGIKDNSFRLWCDVNATHYFDEFRMEGISVEYNEIYVDVDTDALSRAVKSGLNAKCLKMKLTRKNVPYLTLEMKFPSTTNHSAVHDVPVRVIPPRLWKEYAKPQLPVFDASNYAPPAKLLNRVVNSMKNMMVKCITISANNSGEMDLKVESDVVTVTTHFNDLVRPNWRDEETSQINDSQLRYRGNDNQNNDLEKFHSVRVDIKTFLQFLNNQQITFCRLIASIVHMKYLHLFVSNDEFCIQYFIPAVLY